MGGGLSSSLFFPSFNLGVLYMNGIKFLDMWISVFGIMWLWLVIVLIYFYFFHIRHDPAFHCPL